MSAAANTFDTPQKPVVTRFAPSPTGFLHIGGARTALFNWLFAKRHGGQFVLRIEDTDRARSTPEATEAIFEGMRWLGLEWDGDAVSQFERAPRHQAVAEEMIAKGAAYRCYADKEEIAAAREASNGAPFQSPWRDADQASAPDAPFVVRLKAPQSGETKVVDAVQGEVTWKNETLDDLILLRSDGTPTYMLAVVVDDYDMGVSHVIRGDDHLTNAARQTLIYNAMGWDAPIFAHIPLIHGPDGAKLSKRHGALGVEAYRDMGYTPEAMRNYLARLGWSHGDDEIFTTAQAVEWFNLGGVGKAPARFDFDKLAHVNAQHMRMMDDEALLEAFESFQSLRRDKIAVGDKRSRLLRALPALKERSKTLIDLGNLSYFAVAELPISYDEKSQKPLDSTGLEILERLTSQLRNASGWSADELNNILKQAAESEGVKLGKIAQPLRACLSGRGVSPGVIDMMSAIGREETLARLDGVAAALKQEK